MTELKTGKSFGTITGTVVVKENTFQGVQQSKHSDYQYVRINLGIKIAEGNVIYTELMGGYSPSNPIIYGMTKDDNKPVTVNWADRTNENIIDSMADFKIHKVGLERKEDGSLDVKKFLSPIDMEEYLKTVLKDGMEVSVRGGFEFSEYKEETQRKFVIQNIFLPYENKDKEGNVLPVEYGANFTQTVLLDEDSFKKITKDDAKDGEVVVSAYAVNYVGKKDGKKIAKNMTFPLPITVKINKENPELTQKILERLFDVKKGKVRELTIQGDILEGYDQSEVSSQDIELSPEIKELIELGLYSEEEAKKKLVVRGNKVSKLIFTKPFLKKDANDATKLLIDVNDDKYKPEDLFVTIEEEETKSEDPFDVEDQGSGSDSDWMKELGING